ncbi:hypothetical protein GGE08_000197 [Muricauda sp. ARW1Y1]|jgi:hypothetical protein|nr:hypothetical protein [Muricauda sp. ARW1Y1]
MSSRAESRNQNLSTKTGLDCLPVQQAGARPDTFYKIVSLDFLQPIAHIHFLGDDIFHL